MGLLPFTAILLYSFLLWRARIKVPSIVLIDIVHIILFLVIVPGSFTLAVISTSVRALYAYAILALNNPRIQAGILLITQFMFFGLLLQASASIAAIGAVVSLIMIGFLYLIKLTLKQTGRPA
jgi:hypothetical protein